MKKAAFHNLGCKVNAYETEAMQEMLEKAGYEIVPFKEGADVYVINTCTVTNIADRKSRQMLHRARKMNPEAVVVAAGCYVQAQKGKDTDPCIDIVIGNNHKKDLVRILEEYKNIDHKVVAGTLQDVNIDSFCNKYNLDNVCSKPRSNYVLVSKGLDARVVDAKVMKSVEVQPMVVDVTYKKVRNDYEKFKNT